MIQIGELKANSNEKVQGYYWVEHTEFSMPVTIICGEKPGKTILITCGIHGSEYSGIITGMEITKEVLPEGLSGNLIVVHPVNTQGFNQRSRDLIPEDGKNLNRVFPGYKQGTLSEQVAYALTTDFFPLADFYMDLHGGDMFERVLPYVYYPGETEEHIMQESRRAARLLDVKYMVKSSATTGAYNSCAAGGTPSILIERGGQGRWSYREVDEYKQGIYNILRHYGCLDGEVKHPPVLPKEIAFAEHLHAEVTGCWYPQVEIGQSIFKGQKLGEIRNFFDQVIKEESAPYDAIILYMTTTLAVEKGKSLIALGQPEKK